MEKLFQLQAHKTNVRTEIIAGLTTFLAMAYILAVNPLILSDAGLNAGSVFTATALSAAIATLMMAFLANLPVALAPGMGLNAFFTYTVVIGMKYSPATALTAVFFEGLLFILLSFFNVREAIVESIPFNLKKAVAAGIGLFITLIGMKNAEIIVDNPATLVGLGNVTSGPALLGIIGLVITAVLYVLRVPGSILLGILITTVIGIPIGVTVPFGGWENWSIVSLPAAPIFWNFDFSNIFSFQFFTVFFSFLFVDIFDTVGTLVGVTNSAGLVDKNGNIPRVKQALLSDAIGTVFGAMLGTSTVTSFVESTSGVAAGGRTGLTALTTGVFFLIALIFSPLFLLIPSAATAPALIIVGFLMLSAAAEIDFKDPTEGIPAFLTIVMMPFAYSVAEGIVYGIMSYVILKAATGKFKQIPIITWVLFIIFLLRIIFN
ncbi:NCS2 family permease [Treponema sp. OMZ 305]|uniref:NCS2 family permease n=1 Tax=Treponema TaxID=157 RepID=UPI001BAF63B9|nr:MULTISPECIES: NCS2 family permease [Treponema]QUY17809.1 NCS2 family permease [Treponema vincentii]UTC57684.1 NCS2 family permease [Treponema sp. OMZ 305]